MTATKKSLITLELHDSMPRLSDEQRTYDGYGATQDRPAPKYVRSLLAWERAAQKLHKPYAEWSGQQFAAAVQIYKATILKYGLDQPGPDPS